MKITINKIASFKEESVLTTDKKINLCYGLNGSGKTTFSRYLRDTKNEKFSNCKIVPDAEDHEFLVYNQDYVEDTFGETEIKGVFTLGANNKQANENIADAKKAMKTAEKSIATKKTEKTEEKERFENTRQKLIKKIWIEKTNENRKHLDFCVEGFRNNRENFFKKVRCTPVDPSYSGDFDELNRYAADSVGENAKTKTELWPIDESEKNKLIEIENSDIFKKEIIGIGENPMAAFISELKNPDWVKNGLEYLNKQKEKCPFCQQSLQGDIVNDIENYFDGTYKNNIEILEKLKAKFQESIVAIKSSHNHNNEINDKEISKNNEYENAYLEVNAILQHNKERIEKKIRTPSAIIELKPSSDYIIEFNAIVGRINQETINQNTKIANKEKTKKEITENFWKLLRNKYDDEIISFNVEKKKSKTTIDELEEKTRIYQETKKDNESVISENQKKITNVENSAEKINMALKNIGIDNFELVLHDDNCYKIKRIGDDENENLFQSLSEGEKTIISLLYFLERCEGAEEQSEAIHKNNRFIVIDDPNTSLSHVFVFNIAQLIYRKVLCGDFRCVFVLTHSLYFLHELAKLSGQKERNFFRFHKSDISLNITDMEEKDIKNDYQHYWSFVREHKLGKTTLDPLLANIMRNIMEYYFGFIGVDWKSELRNKFSKTHGAFVRYMDRESHSDSINVGNYNELNKETFHDTFEKAFDVLEHKEHFDRMMKNDH